MIAAVVRHEEGQFIIEDITGKTYEVSEYAKEAQQWRQ
jgi:hypothetical protein